MKREKKMAACSQICSAEFEFWHKMISLSVDDSLCHKKDKQNHFCDMKNLNINDRKKAVLCLFFMPFFVSFSVPKMKATKKDIDIDAQQWHL